MLRNNIVSTYIILLVFRLKMPPKRVMPLLLVYNIGYNQKISYNFNTDKMT